jgi:hypothetical protein
MEFCFCGIPSLIFPISPTENMLKKGRAEDEKQDGWRTIF